MAYLAASRQQNRIWKDAVWRVVDLLDDVDLRHRNDKVDEVLNLSHHRNKKAQIRTTSNWSRTNDNLIRLSIYFDRLGKDDSQNMAKFDRMPSARSQLRDDSHGWWSRWSRQRYRWSPRHAAYCRASRACTPPRHPVSPLTASWTCTCNQNANTCPEWNGTMVEGRQTSQPIELNPPRRLEWSTSPSCHKLNLITSKCNGWCLFPNRRMIIDKVSWPRYERY